MRIAVVAAISLVGGFLTVRNLPITIPPPAPIVGCSMQNDSVRQWEAVEIAPLRLPTETNAGWDRPAIIKAYGEKVLIADIISHEVRVLDASGVTTNVIKLAQLSENGIPLQITDFSVMGDTIAVSNQRGSVIWLIGADGQLLSTLSTPEFPPLRVVLEPGGMYTMSLTAGPLISRIGRNGVVRSQFGRIVAGQDLHFMALDGSIEVHNGELLYLSHYSSHLIYLQEDESHDCIVGIDAREFPPVRSIAKGDESLYFQPAADTVFNLAGVSNGVVYVLGKGTPLRPLGTTPFLDIYEVATGRYRMSWKLSPATESAYISGDTLWTVSAGRVTAGIVKRAMVSEE